MQLEQSIDYFLQSKRAEGVQMTTMAFYSNCLYRFAKHMPSVQETEDINAFVIRDYIARMQDDPKLKPISVNRNVRALRVYVKWLRGEDLVRSNPFSEADARNPIKLPKYEQANIDILTDADFRSLLSTCDRGTDRGRRDEAILMFLFDTGVRVGELVDLTRDNLDLKARQARIIGKGRKWRTVFFSVQTAVAVQRYMAKLRKEAQGGEHVFLGWGSKGMTTWAINQMLDSRAKRAGVTARVNPHTFRHTFATNFLRLGGSPATLQRILGHSDISTTIRNYAHLVTDDLAKAHEQYSPLSRALGGR